MAKKIICNLPNRETNPDPNCDGVIAHQISPRMMQWARADGQQGSVVGSNWSHLLTCPRCKREHSVVCTNGTIDESPLTYEDIVSTPNGDPADPNDPNNPGNSDPKKVPTVDEPEPAATA